MAKVFAVRALYVFNECVELVEVGFMDFDKHGTRFHVISGGDDLIVARPRTELTIDQLINLMVSDTLQEFLDVDRSPETIVAVSTITAFASCSSSMPLTPLRRRN